MTPRKNSPRETELRIFSELGQNLGEKGATLRTLYPLLYDARTLVRECNVTRIFEKNPKRLGLGVKFIKYVTIL